ncbi:MAG: hypothetical protein M0D55_08710 [Elusimicrobiota bacterium]|nr:MAG: hypothetical protein M0D55_08710 [Elusimicrobiota bacterium]
MGEEVLAGALVVLDHLGGLDERPEVGAAAQPLEEVRAGVDDLALLELVDRADEADRHEVRGQRDVPEPAVLDGGDEDARLVGMPRVGGVPKAVEIVVAFG